jgi:hypothetical protein
VPNLGEIGNDYWASGVSGIAATYISEFNFSPYIAELSTVPTQVQNGYNAALAAWLYYIGQSSTCSI